MNYEDSQRLYENDNEDENYAATRASGFRGDYFTNHRLLGFHRGRVAAPALVGFAERSLNHKPSSIIHQLLFSHRSHKSHERSIAARTSASGMVTFSTTDDTDYTDYCKSRCSCWRQSRMQLSTISHQPSTIILTQTYVIYDLILLRRLFRFLARFDDGDMPNRSRGLYDDG